MENYLRCLGLICCLVAVVHGASVTVNRQHLFVKPGEKVNLECTGSEKSLSYYIKNRIEWDFIDMNGTVIPLTEGFYASAEAKPKFDTGHYNLSYSQQADGYLFGISVTEARNGDDGVYQCSLINENKVKESEQNVTVHVLHPVTKVQIEIRQDGKTKAWSKEPLSAGATASKLTPGTYTVRCTSTGSNPAPVMTLEADEVAINTQASTLKEVSNDRVQYSGAMNEQLVLKAKAQNQIVRCMSNIGGNNYPDMTAAVLLKVEVDRPNIKCKNFTHARGDRYRSIQCNMTAAGGLTCDKVFWVFGDDNLVVPSQTEKYKDPTGKYDIMQATCSGDEQVLKTNLTIFELKPAHFQAVYYLSYGTGDSAHRHPVAIYEDTTAGTSALVPLSILATIVMAIVSKHLL